MQIGIYSPRPELLRQLSQPLEEFMEYANLSLTLRIYSDSAELNTSLSSAPLDLLLFDTEQSDDPMTQLQRISHTIPNGTLVLLCDDSRYALQGYSVHASDYLITPLSKDKVIGVLTTFLRKRLGQDTYYLPIRINSVWSRVNMDHITYLESAGHTMFFHLNDGRVLSAPVHYRDLEGLLDLNPDFFRCHKSYVVNLRYVVDWDMDRLTLADGNTVSISRPYRQIVRSIYACYVTNPKAVRK